METLYRLDPFYRDENGRFVPKPDSLPEPLRLVAGRVVRKKPLADHWSVRCVRGKDGDWRVLFVYIIMEV